MAGSYCQSKADGRLQAEARDLMTHNETQMVTSPTKLLSEMRLWSAVGTSRPV
jgi:hypothetical protein